MTPSACPSPAAIYSHVDDETLERLNAIALEGGSGHALSTAVLDLIREQHRKGIKIGEDALLVTERRLVDCSWETVEAVLEFGNIVERAGALTRLLGVDDERCAARKAQWQAQLSQLLVRYPVLFHQRLVFAGYFPDQLKRLERAPLPHLIAATPGASLPSVHHGVSERALRQLSALPCVKAGLTRPCVQLSPEPARSRLAGRRPVAIAMDARTEKSAYGARFIASLIRLSGMAFQETGRIVLFPSNSLRERDDLGFHLAEVFWDVATGSWQSGLSRAEVAQAAALQGGAGPLPMSESLLYYVGILLNKGLEGGAGKAALDRKALGVRNAIGMLVEVGACPDHGEAARWIGSQFVGSDRLASGVAPNWTHSEIIAVLDELLPHGVRLEGPPGGCPLVPNAEERTFRTWLEALEMHARKAHMRDAIAARLVEGGAPAQDHAMEPRRRMRQV